jgi:hypothetical protein
LRENQRKVEKLKREEDVEDLRDRGSQGVSRVEIKKSSEIELMSVTCGRD